MQFKPRISHCPGIVEVLGSRNHFLERRSNGLLLVKTVNQPNKTYSYYVGTLSRYVLLPADNAAEALEAGATHPDLGGSTILTVRVASKQEIENWAWMQAKTDEETKPRRVSKK
jgi:hypothetical protein